MREFKKELFERLKEVDLKTVIKVKIPSSKNHTMISTAIKFLDLKRKIKIKAMNLVDEGVDKKSTLRNIIEKFINKEIIKEKIPEDLSYELFPKNTFYENILRPNVKMNEQNDFNQIKEFLDTFEEEGMNEFRLTKLS